MHLHFLDPYHAADSPLHHLDARVKLILVLAFILAVALMPGGAWPGYILLFALILAAALLSGLEVTYAAKRAFLVLPFALAALPILFTTPGTSWLSVRCGPWQVISTMEGLERFASIALKSWISVQAGILLAATTEFPMLLMAMRAIGIPRLLVAIFGLMWRYLFLLVDEAIRLLRARESRSGALQGKGGGSLAWRARVTGNMAGSLFLRGYERSERVYHAMLSRGYDGESRAFPMPPLRRSHWTALALGLSLLVALVAFQFWLE